MWLALSVPPGTWGSRLRVRWVVSARISLCSSETWWTRAVWRQTRSISATTPGFVRYSNLTTFLLTRLVKLSSANVTTNRKLAPAKSNQVCQSISLIVNISKYLPNLKPISKCSFKGNVCIVRMSRPIYFTSIKY